MTEPTITRVPKPLLLARLRHLLVVEGLGSSSSRYPEGVPVAARARTGRHLIALGSASLEPLTREWPEVEHLLVWPDLRRVIVEGDEAGSSLAPVTVTFDEPILDPRSDDPRAVTRQLLRRLVYLHEEEFDGLPIGLLTLSKAWLDLRAVRTLDAHLLEAYLDSTRASERRVIRFCLRDLGFVVDWEHAPDPDLFHRIAERMDRYPLLLAGASPAQIERFKRAGMLSMSFALEPPGTSRGELLANDTDGSRYTLAENRFIVEGPLPGSRGHSLDIGIDRESGEQVLVTKLFVLDREPLPRETDLALPYDGIAALLFLGRVELRHGLANVLVEALPRIPRSDESLPLTAPQAVDLANRVAEILEVVHASGRCVLGLRPELTLGGTQGQVSLVPRGDLLRRLTWPEGPKVEGQEPPFRDSYLAPEVLMGARMTGASDVFSLCAMLTYWITSVHPFARDSAVTQVRAMLTEPPDCHGLSGPLAGPIARGLSPDPGKRPTLAELRRSFSILAGREVSS